ncbi:NADPH-dependent F420 reductase [Periweissella ghanensis]|uniref:Pyrroline-5-carboxylate reductase catalytic N-terminal domain-containing protein n=1 Tax=Periweissella ghanensis TaxID=467997 RepID=A0ABN8BRA6_9LACO|nr:NAD(P)-binding domain-containing protein [Periweissella ghanensis]MCM0601393.1 NAD(P)-binding domain-containing protein [Periweissella ghanensis]CAH0419445.1 hypothetical protein WGH24286_01904 [Periweissella ghanensis]
MTKQIGIIGAGKLGVVLAQIALQAGYQVQIAGSGSAEKIALTMTVLAPGARIMTSTEVLANNEVIILALPLSKFNQLDAASLAGKLVLDAMNYWWEVDGKRAEFNDPRVGTSELVQNYFKDSNVVKAFNHMGYHDLLDESMVINPTNPMRKAIAVAGDNGQAVAQARQIVTDFGFDALVLDDLNAGLKLQPGVNTFGANLPYEDLQTAILNYDETPFGQEIAKLKLQ